MPSFEIVELEQQSVDCIFNSYNLAKISPETIKTLVAQFMRVVRGHIFHVNHNWKSAMIADDFGIDPKRFDLLYKIPALWNSGRAATMNEFEYVYERVRE